jgi:hypothetical protein
MMTLNICRYYLPYIEYNVFRKYIVENLCVKRYEAVNDCCGQCFLNNQINLINEADDSEGSTNSEQHIDFKTDDYVIDILAEDGRECPQKIHATSISNRYISVTFDVPTPPPERRDRY